MKKLYKSNNRMICGVCAGLAEYLGIDPTVVRLIWAALGLTGTGILLYIIAALVMPENNSVSCGIDELREIAARIEKRGQRDRQAADPAA